MAKGDDDDAIVGFVGLLLRSGVWRVVLVARSAGVPGAFSAQGVFVDFRPVFL